MKPAKRALGAGLLLAASTLPCAALADTLIDHVEGMTFDRSGTAERLTGIVIGNDGRIVQVLRAGDRRPARIDYLLDGKGRVLLPGLVDGHAEVMELGFTVLTLDLSAANSLAEAQARIGAYAAAHPDRAWIVGRGWDAARWGSATLPGAAEIDAVVADRPVWLVSADGHTGWANSAALRAAGITAASKDPPGGRIVRAVPGGKPTGALLETALALVDKAVPAPRPEDRDLAFGAAQNLLLERGITTVTDMGTTIEDWQAYRRAGDAGTLRLRVLGYAAGTEAMSLIGGPGPSPWLYDDRLKFNGVVLDLDGALATRGAWLKAPYADAAGSTGLPRLNPTQLRNLMSRAAIDRFQVAVAANGDAATSAALDAIGELAETYKGDRRWRIEGLERVDPADASRFAAQSVIAVLRPGEFSPRVATRLGAERAAGTWPAASLAKGGARLAMGSGAVGGPAPFAAIAAAANRTDAAGQPFGGWQPQERITREAALAAWTAGAAWAGLAESRFGRIAPGQRADFILIDRDPLMAGTSELAQVKVLETWVGGRKVWSAPEGR